MLTRYWVRFEDRTIGPHTLKILHELPGFGPDTLVCPAGEVVWRKAAEVECIKAVLEAESDDDVERMLLSPKERRREERRRKAAEEKERSLREEKQSAEQERQDKIKSLSAAEKGFNPMWLVFLAIICGFGYLLYQNWKEKQEPDGPPVPEEEVLPHPDREAHWAWKALEKSPAEITAAFGKEFVEAIKPDGSARFEPGGDLGRWSRYDQVLILIPHAGAPYGGRDGIGAAALRGAVVRGVGRRFDAVDPEDMPRLVDTLPRSFADAISPRLEEDNMWRLKWDIGRENWGALVMENPGSDGGVKDWRVKELWLTKPE